MKRAQPGGAAAPQLHPRHPALTEIRRLGSSPDIVVREGGIQDLEVRVVDVFEDKAWRLALRISHHIQQLDDVGAPA